MRGDAEVQGRRLPILTGENGRPDLNLSTPFEAGDYLGPVMGYTGDVPAVFFALPVAEHDPDAGLRHVCSPPHTFIENEDGSLTVQPSILAVRPNGNGWHGFLTQGRWQQV